jgi:hypothetical protein
MATRAENFHRGEFNMKATFNKMESWEKCSVWELENGWQAAVQYNLHCGEYVSSLRRDGKGWHASDGLDNKYGTDPDPMMQRIFKDHIAIPDFARAWLDETGLVRPRFEKVFENSIQ